ncbi:transport integral membrane protein [Streptomyces mashuensis]|uniref:Protein YobA n=1 Tax=Streptomyces mashuensis TaxID=33904 RepID=A0A919EBI2_9ACTN|nr:copper resistance protein CopC [Streptomyces mashuensis]GHF42658.1 transport integral membrane protein [Streptomyces mashuensis]
MTRTPVTARRAAALLGTLLAALLCTLTLGAGTASAHAALVSTDPAEGAVVPAAPRQVRLAFSEGVLLTDASVRVLDPRGERVDEGRPAHDGGKAETAVVALRAGIADGTYTVAWQAVSADSHPVAGAFTFSVGAPSKTTVSVATAATRTDPAVATFYGIGRYAAYAGFVLLVGGCLFAALCHASRAVQRVATAGWVTLFLSTALLLLLRGAYTGGKGLGAVADLSLLTGALSTKPGAALLSRLVLLSAAAVCVAVLFGTAGQDPRALRRRTAVTYGLGAAGAVVAGGLAATWAMAEHASAGLQAWLAMPVDGAHLLAVAAWLGGLAALLAALWAGDAVPRADVRRFSRLAFGAVCVLVATGVYQSWRQVGSWDALTGTAYGRLLLLKTALVAAMVGAALLSRRWTARLTDGRPGQGAGGAARGAKDPVRPPKGDAGRDPVRAAQLARQRAALARAAGRRERDADTARAGLRRAVLAEAAVAVVLLAVTTLLTGTQPGRAEEEQRAATAAAGEQRSGPQKVRIAYDTGGANGRGTADVAVDPAGTGGNAVEVRLTGPDGRPVDVAELSLSFTQQQKGIGPLKTSLERRGTGVWRAAGFQLPMAGDWRLTLTVRTSDIDQTTETGNVKVH